MASKDLGRLEHWITTLSEGASALNVAEALCEAMAELLPDTGGTVLLLTPDGEHWVPGGTWREGAAQYPVVRAAAAPTDDDVVRIELRSQGARFGEVRLRPGSGSGNLPPRAGRIARILCAAAGTALAGHALQYRLRQRNVRDPLTGLFNQRYLEDTLSRELHRARRGEFTLMVVRLDVDDYAAFEQDHGSEAATLLIRNHAEILQHSFRGSDVWCRIDTASYAVLLPEAQFDGGVERAETVRKALSEATVSHRKRCLGPLTLSAGVAAYPNHGDGREELLAAAESAVLRAHDAGGNLLRIAEYIGPVQPSQSTP